VKARHLVRLRRTSQAFFLILFFFLLIESRLPTNVYLDNSASDIRLNPPATFFFKLDPLVGISSLLSGHRIITGFMWALAVLGLTVVLGRVFCGFICPFGTLHHFMSWVKPNLKGSRLAAANQKTGSQRIKYFLLILFLVCAVVGLNLTGLMDPIAFLFRSVALAVLPALGTGIRSIVEWMTGSHATFLNDLAYGAEELLAPVFGFSNQAFQTGWFIGLLFIIILFLNRIRPRFWCRTLCPLGALLGICSRAGILALEKYDDKCTQCARCDRQCQGAACPRPGQQWDTSECLVCFNCFNVCPEDALKFSVRFKPSLSKKTDVGRRAVLGGLAAGISLPLLGRLDGRIDRVADPGLIRPPGSLPEKEFLSLCQRCGLCMKACPTNVIHPALGEAGMTGFWTPRLIMTQGYCDYTCTLCGSVCPTGAITNISAKEKIEKPIKIGSAYLDRGRCLPWSANAPCIVCEEHCPTSPKAIYLKEETITRSDGKPIKVRLPFVDLKRCVGCGICENKCPVRGRPAILTISAGETRSPQNQILL